MREKVSSEPKKNDEIRILQDVLGLVSHKVTLKEIKSWSPAKREKVLKWAGRTHLRASDNIVRIPPKPKFKYKEMKFEETLLW